MTISPSVRLMEAECVGEESHHARLHMVSPAEHLCMCTIHEQRDTHVTTAAEAQKIPVMSRATLQSLSTRILTSGHPICLSVSFPLPHHLSPPLTRRCRLFYLIHSHGDHYLWHFANTERWTGLFRRLRTCSLWLTLLWCSPGRSPQRPPERKEASPESNQCFQKNASGRGVCLSVKQWGWAENAAQNTNLSASAVTNISAYLRRKYFFTVPELR